MRHITLSLFVLLSSAVVTGCSGSSQVAELKKKLEIHETNLKLLNERIAELDRFAQRAKIVLDEHRGHIAEIERRTKKR